MKLKSKRLLPFALLALIPGATSCSAPKATSALPAQATAPTLTVSSSPDTDAAPKPIAQPLNTTEAEKASASNSPDPITELIASVEKEYQAGLEHQRAGQLDAAKKNF